MADYATTQPVGGPLQMAPLPGWAAPAPGDAPNYDQLRAQARMKMMDMPAPAPRPEQPSPSSWSDAGIFGAGQPPAPSDDERLRNLPPGIRSVLERLPQDQQERLLGMWGNRGAGFTDRQPGEGGGGGRGFDAGQGRQADGSMAGPGEREPSSPSTGGGFGGFGGFGFGKQPLGKGWRAGTALASAINPFAGLAAEGARRASNVSYANSQRDMLGMERPGMFGDFFSGAGGGSPTNSIGKVDVGGRSTDVSYGGILGSGRTSYTPEEARRRQVAQNYGGYRGENLSRAPSGGFQGRDESGGSTGYGGGGDDFDPSGRW